MKYCCMCGKELVDEAVVCTNCGCATENYLNRKKFVEKDEISIGLCILAFFIPLFGIIYWPVKHSETPKRAKACGITGIVSAAIPIFIWLLLIVIGIIATFSTLYY